MHKHQRDVRGYLVVIDPVNVILSIFDTTNPEVFQLEFCWIGIVKESAKWTWGWIYTPFRIWWIIYSEPTNPAFKNPPKLNIPDQQQLQL